MRAVLADTGPLYAAAIPSDQHHERAGEDMERLAREGLEVIVAYPTLLETQALILRRSHPSAVHGWLQEMSRKARLVNPAPDDYMRAAERTRRYSDQSITLFDAVVATLGERLDLPVWTFDHHFDVMGADVWR
ncbi:MAG: type II toxin-antitoxin system VapC family toxin [Rubrobacteraceae bacterium]